MKHPFVKLPGENITNEVMNIPAQGKCSLNDRSSCTGIVPLWSCAHNMPQSAVMKNPLGSFIPNPESTSTSASQGCACSQNDSMTSLLFLKPGRHLLCGPSRTLCVLGSLEDCKHTESQSYLCTPVSRGKNWGKVMWMSLCLSCSICSLCF